MAVHGVIQLVGSAARTASSNNHASPVVSSRYREGIFFLNCSAASGTTPTLDALIETYDDLSAIWYPIASFTQLVTTGYEAIRIPYGLGKLLSVAWTIGGTTPSFTFQINGILKD